MMPLSPINDSTHSLQGRDGVETNTKPKSAQTGNTMQVGGSELPAHATVNAVTEPEKLEALKNELNQNKNWTSRQIAFELTEDYPTPILQVLDRTSGEVIRQIPGDEVIQMREKLAATLETMQTPPGTLIEIDT